MKPAHSAALLLSTCLLFIPPGMAQNSKSSQLYEDALRRFHSKDVAGSIIQLKNVLQADRNHLPALLLLGKASLEDSNPGAAEAAFDEALKRGASRSEVSVLLARALVEQGKQALMLDDPRCRVEGLPVRSQAELLLVRAAATSDLGNERGALELIRQARGLTPQSADTWAAEVPIRIRGRQVVPAIDAGRQAVKLEPDSAGAHYQLGAALHVGGRLDEALAAYDRAIQLSPGHLEALIARAGIYFDRQQPAKAAADIKTLRQRFPKDPRADYLSGLIAANEGNQTDSQASMRRVVELLDPLPIESLRFRPQLLILGGLAHHALGEREKALPYLEQVVKLQPSNPAAKAMAQVLFELGQTENGIRLLENYLQGNPNDLQAISLLAVGHSDSGRQSKSVQILSRALEVRDDPQLRGALGRSLLRAGQFEAAQLELEQAVKRAPAHLGNGVALTMLYLRTQQAGKALASAKRVLAMAPDSPPHIHLMGIAQAAAKDLSGARASFQRALKLNPHLVEAEFSLAKLDAAERHFPAALGRLQRLHDGDPKAIEPLLLLAEVSEAAGRAEDAAKWLERAVSAAGARETRPALALTGLQLRRGMTSQAVQTAKTLAAMHPDDSQVLLPYARTLLANGERNAAKAPLVAAGRKLNSDPDMLGVIGALQVDAEDYTNARYTLQKAHELAPNSLRTQVLLGTIELRSGDLAAAERWAQKVVKAFPKEAAAHLLAADLATAKKDAPGAGTAIRRAHEAAPSPVTAHRLLSHLAHHEPAGVGTFATSWLKANPNDAEFTKLWADHLLATEQFAAAKSTYERALRIQPSDPAGWNNLALTLIRLKDPKGALQAAARARSLAPTSPIALDTQAWALLHDGQAEAALAALREALIRAPDHAQIRYHLAVTLAKLGRHAEARTELTAALANPAGLESEKEAREFARTLK